MLHFELPFLFAISAIALIFFRRTRGIQKREAAIILGLYLGYVMIKIASI
jgi:Ca2+/Na+ antiporter